MLCIYRYSLKDPGEGLWDGTDVTAAEAVQTIPAAPAAGPTPATTGAGMWRKTVSSESPAASDGGTGRALGMVLLVLGPAGAVGLAGGAGAGGRSTLRRRRNAAPTPLPE